MGRLMLSILLSEQSEILAASNTPERLSEESVEPPAKWSASNAFDPDSEEFWNEDEVVYEVFMDTDATNRRERLEEEAHLIASGNESRRRRRESPWVTVDNIFFPETDLSSDSGTRSDGTVAADPNRPLSTVIYDRLIPVRVTSAESMRGDRGEEEEEEEEVDRVMPVRQSRTESHFTSRNVHRAHQIPAPSPGFPTPSISVEMISDASHRSASPLPYVTYGDVHVYTPTVHHPDRTRHRRRESQPAPTTISLMG